VFTSLSTDETGFEGKKKCCCKQVCQTKTAILDLLGGGAMGPPTKAKQRVGSIASLEVATFIHL